MLNSSSRNVAAGQAFRSLFAAATMALSTVAQAESVDHDKIRPSLVYLHAIASKATGKEGTGSPNETEIVESTGTGFLVSADGLVVTTYDLISSLGADIDPNTVRIAAHVGAKTSVEPELLAIIIDQAIITDLVLLKLPPPLKSYDKVALGNAHEHKDEDLIYTSGFPSSVNYLRQEGKIRAREARAHEAYAWTTSLDFERGLSGSPIYDVKGKIIGVLKNESGDSSTIIPIGFADTLLAQVRLREIQQALGDFDALRSKFEWTLRDVGTSDDPQLNLVYKKLVPGEPKITKIDVYITPFGEASDKGLRKQMGAHVLSNLSPITIDNRGGTFALPQLVPDLKNSRGREQIKNITELRILIVPFLPDGNTLPKETFTAPYELDDPKSND